MTPFTVALFGTSAVFLLMLGELRLSLANERRLRARGAREPAGDVYATMQWTYPLCFVAMAVEGSWRGPAPGTTTLAGAALLAAAKALKFWAIASLGERWTFRVLVPPAAPLVVTGPYALLRHPNYVAVIGELSGFALLVGAPVTGVVGAVGFGLLIRRRIAVEDRALGRRVSQRS